ncbi:unnamed protein product, partial [Sphacelaria rigidula]
MEGRYPLVQEISQGEIVHPYYLCVFFTWYLPSRELYDVVACCTVRSANICPLGYTRKCVFGGVLVILHAMVTRPFNSHPYKAGMEHARFSPD